MPVTHSTTRPVAVKIPKPKPAKPAKPAKVSAAAKAPLAIGKSVKKSPVKAAGKTAASSKVSVKKAIQKPVKDSSKAVKAAPNKATKPAIKPAPKPAKVAVKAGKAAPKPSASKVSKTGPQKAKVEIKVDKAGQEKSGLAAKGGKAVPKPAKAVPVASAPANKINKVDSKKEAAKPAKHSLPEGGGAVVEKATSKSEKAEPKKERSHEAKKPLVRRSTLVDFPVPPPPVRPPFVPPKPVMVPQEVAPPTGSNGLHSPAFIQKQRQRLLDLRDDLVDALSGMTRDTIRNAPEGSEASGSGMHQGDAGSDAYDRDFALSVLAKEQDALYEIDQALRRIQKGIYGVCEMSNRKILQARLEAIPFARLTVECQAQWEKEYGNRRFRPSNEVGFSGGNLIEDEDSETVLLDDEEE
jgi:RNA polymerase-binding transcription factor DksA